MPIKPLNEYNDLMFIVGENDKLTIEKAIDQAKIVCLACLENQTANITISIYGFDDDPRELAQIPEAVLYIAWFAGAMQLLGLPPNFAKRLTPESLRWAALGEK